MRPSSKQCLAYLVRETDRVNDTITSRQAFDAMRLFLARFNEREPIERRQTIDQLLRRTKVEHDGWTNDPAQWTDWERAVTEAGGVTVLGRYVSGRSGLHDHIPGGASPKAGFGLHRGRYEFLRYMCAGDDPPIDR